MNFVSTLMNEFSGKVDNLSCHIMHDRLRLSGTTTSFYFKQLLQERAKKLTGMRIENLVEVATLHSA